MIRAATRVTSFPPDYLANGEGGELCWQRVSFCAAGREDASRKISIAGSLLYSRSLARSFRSRGLLTARRLTSASTLAPFKISHF